MDMTHINDKTIFVLDHTQYFGISSENFIELDGKSKNSQVSLCKSLWTHSVEATMEYCRIVWDLFPNEKIIRVIVSDSAAHVLNTWNNSTQNVNYITNAMSMIGVPQAPGHSGEHSVIHGLRAAVDALAEPSEVQKETPSNIVQNRGRVICLTSARDDKSMVSLEEIFNTVLTQHNEVTVRETNCLPIHLCHFVIINITPMHMGLLVSDRETQDISKILFSEVHSVHASDVSNKLTHLILNHFDLASTTVTGIPMKEEQNANSSANYDVEILHSKTCHSVFYSEYFPTNIKEGAKYETITLKWSTPRGSIANDLQFCLDHNRVTPVDVTSRPSSCLINFLINGRSVLLEMPKKNGGKQTSHLLSARGGEIFIHSLPFTRSCFEDCPSISEGYGGKVVDYRISEFAAALKSHNLLPIKHSFDENLEKARARLHKKLFYFPLSLGLTIVYNMQFYIESLLAIIAKDELNENDVMKCQQILLSLLSLTARQESVSTNFSSRSRTSKKEEQFKLLWNEVELIISSSGNSSGHKSLLSSLRDYKIKCYEIFNKNKHESNPHSGNVDNLNVPVEFFNPKTIHETGSASGSSDKSKRTTHSGNKTLLGLLVHSQKKQIQKRAEFYGRTANPSGSPVKLYPNFGKTDKN